MTTENELLIQEIHAAGRPLVLAVTGGGSEALARLLAVPGASRSILEGAVPYSPAALARWLGGQIDHACSQATARAMAMAGFRRALEYVSNVAEDQAPAVAGIACTASLASDRPKRGAHRIHAALQTATTSTAVSLELVKGARTRAEEEQLAADLVLNLAAETASISRRLPLDLSEGEEPQRASIVAPEPWQQLLLGKIACTKGNVSSNTQADPRQSTLIFPGAFNPLHEGHRQMAAVAERLLGGRVAYEISITNADKPPLDYLEIDRRVRQFASDETLWLTREPTFVEKGTIFSKPTFLVGVDTLARIADPKYYDGGGLSTAIAALTERGVRFLVFGRVGAGRFQGLADLQLPAALAALCQEVPEMDFRSDVSSTMLRQQDTG